MKLTIAHLLDLIDELPKKVDFDYVKPGKKKARLISVDREHERVEMARVDIEDQSIAPSVLIRENLQTLVDSIIENKPFSIDKIFNNGGNTRSVWESIIANTSEFYKCMVGRNKNLVWMPTEKHNIGEIVEKHQLELPIFDSENTNNRESVKEEFRFFLSKCVKSARGAGNEEGGLGTTAIGSYVSFLETKDDGTITLFDYAPQKWQHIKDIYSITDPIVAQEIRDKLNSDEEFLKKDKETSAYWRSGAIGYYVLFLRARTYFSKNILPHNTNKRTLNSEGTSTSYLPYLTALRTKPFMLLAGISGTGKSRIVRELAFKSCPKFLQDQDGTTPGNYCMIEVKPNWHDSSELLGYYSNIAKQYVFTDFVKFLLKAKLYSDVPFFVCMDEMNLAPVEQYFAEFLSVLETRKQTKLGIKTGALVKGHYFKRIKSVNEYDNVQTDADVYTLLEIPMSAEQKEELAKTNSLKTEGLTLQENVFVIGTVNMDDTTHQFSRKVLDRAMTIEMNGGELKDMFGHSSDLEYLPEENVWKINQFKPKHVNADEVLEEHIDSNGDLDETGIALKTQLADKLDAINQVLKDTPFVVSYRVLNELVIYAGVLLDDGRETEEAINDAVDQITLMKILPRIEGDEDLLGNAKDENNRLCQLMKVVGPQSQAKLREMNRRLESRFTRFWP